MKYVIKNNFLNVELSDTGAEITSIKKAGDNIEYLWQGNPQIWNGQAPLLFPLIGRLKDEEFIYEGKTYKIGIHGFARFMKFDALQAAADKIEFTLNYSEQTLEKYPFKFNLKIIYELRENTIIKKHVVKNLSNDDMYYEIGGHEGYNLAYFEGECMEDYYIEFYDMEKIQTYTTDERIMINKEKKHVPYDEKNRIYLTPEIFRDDAFIIDGFKTHKVSIRGIKHDRCVTVIFDDFEYLGIWTKYMRSNYVCLEPWSSLPDCNFLGKELTCKKGIRKLKGNDSETLQYIIIIE